MADEAGLGGSEVVLPSSSSLDREVRSRGLESGLGGEAALFSYSGSDVKKLERSPVSQTSGG